MDKLKKAMPKPATKAVRSKPTKQLIKSLVDRYFREARPAFLRKGMPESQMLELDSNMQILLEQVHKDTLASKYLSVLKASQVATVQLEQACLRNDYTTITGAPGLETVDQQIIQTLNTLLPSAASAYQQAILDLNGNERLSWRGPATDLRESLRETLDHLAPDKDVQAQSGFRLEQDAKGPTMKQKVRYVLSKRGVGKSSSATTEDAVSTIEALLGAFVRSVYRTGRSGLYPRAEAEC